MDKQMTDVQKAIQNVRSELTCMQGDLDSIERVISLIHYFQLFQNDAEIVFSLRALLVARQNQTLEAIVRGINKE